MGLFVGVLVYYAFTLYFLKIFLLNREFLIYSVYLSILIICPLSSGCIGEYAIIFILFLLRFSLSLFLTNLIIACFATLFFIIILLMVCQDLGDLSVHSFHQIWNFLATQLSFCFLPLCPLQALKLMTGGSLDIIPWVSDALFMFFPLFLCFYFLREPIAMYSSPLTFLLKSLCNLYFK